MVVPFMLAPFMLLVPVLMDVMGVCISALVEGMFKNACSDSGDSSSRETRWSSSPSISSSLKLTGSPFCCCSCVRRCLRIC
jgi:hypothetical protein